MAWCNSSDQGRSARVGRWPEVTRWQPATGSAVRTRGLDLAAQQPGQAEQQGHAQYHGRAQWALEVRHQGIAAVMHRRIAMGGTERRIEAAQLQANTLAVMNGTGKQTEQDAGVEHPGNQRAVLAGDFHGGDSSTAGEVLTTRLIAAVARGLCLCRGDH